MISISVQEKDFDTGEEYRLLQSGNTNIGGVAIFTGQVRDLADNPLKFMRLEHYPGMTEKHLKTICEEAENRWELLDTLIIHRVGRIQVNDPIVLVAAWSAHRGGAMEACRYLIEELKHRAPFWKQEQLSNSDENRWVSGNTKYEDHA